MLSPHEFATLMLVRHAPDQIDMNRAELDALLERQLVMLEHSAEGHRRAKLTEMGRSFLEAFSPSIDQTKTNDVAEMASTTVRSRCDQSTNIGRMKDERNDCAIRTGLRHG